VKNKLRLAIFFIVGMGWACKPVAKNSMHQFSALQLVTGIPILDGRGLPFLYEGSIIRLANNNLILYMFPETRSFSSTTVDKEGSVVADSLVSLKVLYSYFVYEKGQKTGLYYPVQENSDPKKLSVDSILAVNTITNAPGVLKNIVDNGTLVSHLWSSNRNSLTEVYLTKEKKDLSYSDTTILIYSKKLNKFDFSLLPHMDSIKGIKLVELKKIYNPVPDTSDIYLRSRRVMFLKMEEVPVPDEKKTVSILERFAIDNKRY